MNKSQKNILIFSLFAVNLVYFISSAYIIDSNDGSHFALVSALVEEKSVSINNYIEYTYFFDYNLKDGNYYSDRPPGTAFLSLPFYLIGKILIETGMNKHLSSHAKITEIFVLFLPNIAGTLSVLLLFKLYTFFKFRFALSLFSSFIFAFGTLSWFESTRLYSHILSLLIVLSSVYLVITLKRFNNKNMGRVIAIALLLGLASIIEIQNILFVPIFGIYLILSHKIDIKRLLNRNIIKTFLLAVLAFSFVYSILLVYNFIAFDDLTIKSNKYNPRFPEESRFATAFSGNPFSGIDSLFTSLLNHGAIFDWSKGTKNDIPGSLIISPILVLSLIGFYYFFRFQKNEALFFVLLILAEVIVVSFHKAPLTRHISTILPFLFFPLIYIIQKSFNQIKNKNNTLLKRYSLFYLIIILFSFSVARVFYSMNTYWARSLTSPFPFIHEIPSYVFFYGTTFFVFFLFKSKLLRKFITSKILM